MSLSLNESTPLLEVVVHQPQRKQAGNHGTSIQNLPDELLDNILSRVGNPPNVALVCRKWSWIGGSQQAYLSIFTRLNFRISPHQLAGYINELGRAKVKDLVLHIMKSQALTVCQEQGGKKFLRSVQHIPFDQILDKIKAWLAAAPDRRQSKERTITRVDQILEKGQLALSAAIFLFILSGSFSNMFDAKKNLSLVGFMYLFLGLIFGSSTYILISGFRSMVERTMKCVYFGC